MSVLMNSMRLRWLMEKRIRFDIKVARKDKMKKGELGYNQLKRPQNPFLIGFFVAAGSSISPLRSALSERPPDVQRRSPAFTFFYREVSIYAASRLFFTSFKKG